MGFRQGEDRTQITMLPECVDDYVSEDNTARVIDAYVNSLDLAKLGFAKTEPNILGRPMYDPRDMLKLYMYGYMNRTRSSRRLETETKRNLEVIWLMCKLSPDHKTIARFRRDNADALKNVFKDFVRLCARLGLYGKELVAIDGSKFKAVNSKDRNFTEKKLKARIARLDAKLEEYLKQLDEQDALEDEVDTPKTAEEIQEIIASLQGRKARYEGYVEELKETGETQKSLTDPDSRLMMGNGKLDVSYNVQSSVDSKNKMVVEYEVTNCAQDKNQLSVMAQKTADILETEGLTVTADAGYDNASEIAECVLNGITPHVANSDVEICIPTDAVREEPMAAHTSGRSVYLRGRNIVICPMGRILYPRGYARTKQRALYQSSDACRECSSKCTTERCKRVEIAMKQEEFSKEYDDGRINISRIRVTPERSIVKQRKGIVEHPFGTLKRTMDAGYCLLKGKQYVTGEFALAFLAYNFRRAINVLGAAKLIAAVQG